MQRQPAPTDSRTIDTNLAPRSLFRTSTGVHDSDTNEGLSAALVEISVHGWDSDAGRAVTESLNGRCAGWWATWRQTYAARSAATRPGDVLSIAWTILKEYAANIAAAEAGWPYLWTSVCRALCAEESAAAILSDSGVRRDRIYWPVGVDRLGHDEGRTPGSVGLDGSHGRSTAYPESDQSPAVATFVSHLAGGDPAEARFWADAVDRAIDVMAGSRRSYEEVNLRRDVYLTVVLGLSATELAALAALLIGPRKGDRAAQSLLLALHRNLEARPEDVVGAVDRVTFLTSRRHAGVAVMVAPVAARLAA